MEASATAVTCQPEMITGIAETIAGNAEAIAGNVINHKKKRICNRTRQLVLQLQIRRQYTVTGRAAIPKKPWPQQRQ